MVNWGDIFEAIRLNRADTLMADAFRKAAGLPPRHNRGEGVAHARKSAYAGIDWKELMGQRYGVRM